jgi:hypothetical protein
MGPNRITPGGAKRRRRGLAAAGSAPRLAALIAAALAVGLLLGGCGGGGDSTAASGSSAPPPSTTARDTARPVDEPTPSRSPEESADAEILNDVLDRQEAAVVALAHVAAGLPPRLRRTVAYFRAQEQEHVDGVVKAMRGLKRAPTESEPEAIEIPAMKTDAERLRFVYEIESVTIEDELNALADLEGSGPRSLLASTVANQAQHLTLLRQELGAGPLASVPVPFENGTAEPPE